MTISGLEVPRKSNHPTADYLSRRAKGLHKFPGDLNRLTWITAKGPVTLVNANLIPSIIASVKLTHPSRCQGVHGRTVAGRPPGIRGPESSGPTPGLRPTHTGCPVGQGKKGPGDPRPSGTADRPDRGHQFRDGWPGQVDRGVPGHGLEVGAVSGPPGH